PHHSTSFSTLNNPNFSQPSLIKLHTVFQIIPCVLLTALLLIHPKVMFDFFCNSITLLTHIWFVIHYNPQILFCSTPSKTVISHFVCVSGPPLLWASSTPVSHCGPPQGVHLLWKPRGPPHPEGAMQP
uniref:Uncharacterized protein n=1 Tax=Chelonoidis abingdonii TaxID=106734 RepID=A0A8C0IW09_CHEAB